MPRTEIVLFVVGYFLSVSRVRLSGIVHRVMRSFRLRCLKLASIYALGLGVCGGGCGVFPAPLGDGSRCPKCNRLLRLSKRNGK